MISKIMCTCMLVVAVAAAGCLSVKTEHEVKPIEIHATIDLNLNVDSKLEKSMAESDKPDIRKLFERGVIGLDNKAMLVPRGALSSDEMDSVTDLNGKMKERRVKIAKEEGVSYDDVVKRSIVKWQEHMAEGSWYQGEDGAWVQKRN